MAKPRNWRYKSNGKCKLRDIKKAKSCCEKMISSYFSKNSEYETYQQR